MTTKHTRVNVTLNADTEKALHYLSKKSHQSLSKVAFDLIQEALELREDMYLSKIADAAYERNKNKPTISDEEVWKQCGLE